MKIVKNMEISHSKPTIGKDDITAVEKTIKTSMISSSLVVKRFEDKICSYIKGIKARATSSGRDALFLALLALDIKEGDEVLIPSYVCRSVMDTVYLAKANPVIVDIGDDYCISYEAIEKKITKKTKVIVVAHIFGIMAEIKKIVSLTRKKNIYLIEDCAQSIGAEISRKRLGSFGDISIFSFHATKVMTTGEGGMLLINNKEILKNYTQNKNLFGNFSPMSDINASLGISQLRKLGKLIKKRRLLAKRYIKLLKNIRCIEIPVPDFQKSIYFRFPVRITKKYDFISLREKMAVSGIQIRKGVDLPLHHINKNYFCPKTELLFHETVSLPIYPALRFSDVDRICRQFKKLLQFSYMGHVVLWK